MLAMYSMRVMVLSMHMPRLRRTGLNEVEGISQTKDIIARCIIGRLWRLLEQKEKVGVHDWCCILHKNLHERTTNIRSYKKTIMLFLDGLYWSQGNVGDLFIILYFCICLYIYEVLVIIYYTYFVVAVIVDEFMCIDLVSLPCVSSCSICVMDACATMGRSSF